MLKHTRFSKEKFLCDELSKVNVLVSESNLRLQNICTKHQYKSSLDLLSSGIQVDNENSPILNSIFDTCVKKLFHSKNVPNINFFVIPGFLPNAGLCYLDDNNYAVNITSSLLDLCSEGQIAFVLGHELGHLKYKHHKLNAASGADNLSATIHSKLLEYNRLCEITADRAGLICSNFYDATQALFNIAIGTKSDLLKFNPSQISSQLNNLKILLEDKKHLRQSKLSHPYSLIRLAAINQFNNFLISKNNETITIDHVDEEINKALSLMNPEPHKFEDTILLHACCWVAFSDNDIADAEIQSIYSFCKPELVDLFLEQIRGLQDNTQLKFIKAEFKKILKKNTITLAAKATILEKLLCVSKADNFIRKTELSSIREIGGLLDLDQVFIEKTIAQITKTNRKE